eukprot:scaffold7207_cov520-Prasinococcus_capsulatus_cf.AAC.18
MAGWLDGWMDGWTDGWMAYAAQRVRATTGRPQSDTARGPRVRGHAPRPRRCPTPPPPPPLGSLREEWSAAVQLGPRRRPRRWAGNLGPHVPRALVESAHGGIDRAWGQQEGAAASRPGAQCKLRPDTPSHSERKCCRVRYPPLSQHCARAGSCKLYGSLFGKHPYNWPGGEHMGSPPSTAINDV